MKRSAELKTNIYQRNQLLNQRYQLPGMKVNVGRKDNSYV